MLKIKLSSIQRSDVELWFYQDSWFYQLSDLLEYISESNDEPSDYPVVIHACRKEHRVYISPPSALDVATDLFIDLDLHTSGQTPNFYMPITANTIGESLLESFYSDMDGEPPDYPLVGVDELQSGIDWFIFWNNWLYRLLGDFGWFDPSRHSIGLSVLDWHLERFAQAQKDRHFIYLEERSDLVEVEFQDVQYLLRNS